MQIILKLKRFLYKKIRVSSVIYHPAPWLELLGGAFILYWYSDLEPIYFLALYSVFLGIRALLYRAVKNVGTEDS